MELLSLIEILAQYDYLHLPQGNVIIDYLIKLSEPDPSVSRLGWRGSEPPGQTEARVRNSRTRQQA
jgi:hypothetical protein